MRACAAPRCAVGHSRRNKLFLSIVSTLSLLAIAVLYVDVGLRGSFDTESNLRLFYQAQVVDYSFSASLADVVGVVFARSAVVLLQALLRKKFSTVPTLVFSSLFLVFVGAKAIVFASSHGLRNDNLQWAILFIASGYALLELLMALLGRMTTTSGVTNNADARRGAESSPLLEHLFAVPTTLPAAQLATPSSRFTHFQGVQLHYTYVAPPPPPPPPTATTTTATTTTATTATTATASLTSSTASSLDDGERAPLVLFVHGLGGCAATFDDVARDLASRSGLAVAAFDRPGWGLTERDPRPTAAPRRAADSLTRLSSSLDAAPALAASSASAASASASASALAAPGSATTALGAASPYSSQRSLSALGELSPPPPPAPPPPHTVLFSDAFAADCAAHVAQHCGARRIVLVAHGDGARVALRICLRHPRLVCAMVLVAPCVYASELPWNQHALLSRFPRLAPRIYTNFIEQKVLLGNYFFDARRVSGDKRLQRAFRSTMRVNGWDDALVLFAQRDAGERELLRLIVESSFASTPTMLLHGENDATLPLAHAVQLASELDVVKFQTLRMCGHAPHLERSAAFVAGVCDFLAELELLAATAASTTTAPTTTAPTTTVPITTTSSTMATSSSTMATSSSTMATTRPVTLPQTAVLLPELAASRDSFSVASKMK